MTKAECRKIFRQKRKQLTQQQLVKWDDLLLIQFQKIQLPYLDCVHTYIPLEKENEIDTSSFIRYLKFKNPGLLVVSPKINFNTEEIHQVIFDDESELVVNRHGIEEPADDRIIPAEETNLVFVPLLAFDKKGYRVGYGKGYYDKFLAQCDPAVIKIGLSYFEPVDAITDVNDYDIPLNYGITPENVYRF